MEIVSKVKQSFNDWFGLFSDGSPKKIGVYGPPNAGKCIHPDEKVTIIENGVEKNVEIEELFDNKLESVDSKSVNDSGFETVVYPEDTIEVQSVTGVNKIESQPVSKLYRQRYVGQLYKIETKDGMSIRVSPKHPLLTDTSELEYTQAKQVCEGDTVGCTHKDNTVNNSTNVIQKTEITTTEIERISKQPYIGYIYDITVPESQNFMSANGIVLHNTTLTNYIIQDWSDEEDVELQSTSEVPHETRQANQEAVEIEYDETSVSFSIVDTPGLDTEVDYEEFTNYGLEEDEAIERSREATEGIAEAMHWLKQDIDGVVYMMDSTKDPFTQVNTMTTGIIESKDIPAVVLANKTDLEEANVKRIRKAYPQHDVVPVSALEGDNMDTVYEELAEKFG